MKLLTTAIALMVCTAAHSQELQPWQDSAAALVTAETKVREAMWSQPESLWVSMVDDGSRRDGFAEYLCFVLQDAGRPAGEFVAITIWDAASMSSGSLRRIGRATCTF